MGKIERYLYEHFPVVSLDQYELVKAQLRGSSDLLGQSALQYAELKMKCDGLGDLLAAKTLELEALKNKIVERAQTPSIIKAKSAAEIRSLMEREAEREFEEQANGA